MPEGEGGEQTEAAQLMHVQPGPQLQKHVRATPEARHLVLEKAALEGEHAVKHLLRGTKLF